MRPLSSVTRQKKLLKRTARKSPILPAGSRLDALLRKNQRILIAGLCVYAGVRILFFAAAFPIGNNVDEQHHFDTVFRFVKGAAPQRELPPWDPYSAQFFALYGSPEYLLSPELMEGTRWQVPLAEMPPDLEARLYPQVLAWQKSRNVEAQSPPVYYAAAAVWYRIGGWLGLGDWQRFYWVRFFNAAALSLLVWISYRFVSQVYPGHQFLHMAVPALVAVFPQDLFFGVTRDALTAPCAALALWLIFKLLLSPTDRPALAMAAGLGCALAFLVSVPNFVLFGALGLAFWARTQSWSKRKSAGFPLREAALAALGALLPTALWMVHNYRIYGDLTASRSKIEALTWTIKPAAEIFDHPMFSFSGASHFLAELVRTFWRGEYTWHGHSLSLAAADWLYIGSSGLLLAAFLFQLLRLRRTPWSLERFSDFVLLFLVASSVLFMAAISLAFDFHDCVYPSRLHPYFVSGRIVFGVLLPFCILYVRGLEFAMSPIRSQVHPIFGLAFLVLVITAAELVVSSPVFSSSFNLFALAGFR